MNTDKETKQRFKRKVLNACNSIDALVTFIEVHNEDDESPAFRRGCETQDELGAMSTQLARIFGKIKA